MISKDGKKIKEMMVRYLKTEQQMPNLCSVDSGDDDDDYDEYKFNLETFFLTVMSVHIP